MFIPVMGIASAVVVRGDQIPGHRIFSFNPTSDDVMMTYLLSTQSNQID
jgi:hypothetical protein